MSFAHRPHSRFNNLGKLIEPNDEEVPWPIVFSILTVVRFCTQPSELSIETVRGGMRLKGRDFA